MLSLGLSAADQKLFEASLSYGYNLKIVAQILDLNHKYIRDISAQLIDGQVNYSYAEEVNSAASMTILDPDELVGFDTSSPSDNALYADRMIRLVYCVYSELLPRWVDVPIFCGPVTKVRRDDVLLSVECQGKEVLVSEPTVVWAAKTYKKTTTGVAAIRDLMTLRGETKFDLPGYTYTLGQDYVLGVESVPWAYAKAMAGSTRQLFYDGRGVLRLRDVPARPVWTFTEPMLISVPKLDYDHANVRNGALVKGATPVTGKPQLRAYRFLPASDGSSREALGRNGKLRYMMEVLEDTTLITQAAVNSAADKLMATVGKTNVGFEFDSFVIPHLEPGDIFHLSTRDMSIELPLTTYSIPLRAGAQSNGVIKKLSTNRARLRR